MVDVHRAGVELVHAVDGHVLVGNAHDQVRAGVAVGVVHRPREPELIPSLRGSSIVGQCLRDLRSSLAPAVDHADQSGLGDSVDRRLRVRDHQVEQAVAVEVLAGSGTRCCRRRGNRLGVSTARHSDRDHRHPNQGAERPASYAHTPPRDHQIHRNSALVTPCARGTTDRSVMIMYAAHKIDSSHQRLFPAIGECAFRQISRRRNTIRTPARHAMTAIRTPRRAGGPVVPCVNVNHRRKDTANTLAALNRSAPSDPTAPRSTPSWRTFPHIPAWASAAGRRKNKVKLCFPRPTPPGPTRSWPAAAVHPGQREPPQPPRANPGPAPIPVLAQHRYRPTSTSLQPGAVNAPASVAKRASAGAGAPSHPQSEHRLGGQ